MIVPPRAVFALLVGWVALLVAVSAAPTPSAPAPHLRTPQEALVMDAHWYAERFDVPPAQALVRLQRQEAIEALEATLRGLDHDQYAGLWVQHEPVYRVVVQWTRPVEADIAQLWQPLAELVEVRYVTYALDELARQRQTAETLLRQRGIPFQSGTRISANRVHLFIEDGQLLDGLDLPPAVVPVVGPLLRKQANLYGGLKVIPPSTEYCTVGFTVKNSSGQHYLSTSGHCDNDLDLAYIGGTQLPPPIYDVDAGAIDFQAHPAPAGYDLRNWVMDNVLDDTPFYRVINTQQSKYGTEGGLVCKYGATTYYTCGVISMVNYNPHTNNNNSNSFVRVEGVSTCGGDSGAPWFLGSKAYGFHLAGLCAGASGSAAYMPVNSLWSVGFNVATVAP